jgi:hypothetical protein
MSPPEMDSVDAGAGSDHHDAKDVLYVTHYPDVFSP